MRADGGGYEKMAGPDDRIFLALCTAAHFWWLADWWADVGMGPPVGEGRAGEAARMTGGPREQRPTNQWSGFAWFNRVRGW